MKYTKIILSAIIGYLISLLFFNYLNIWLGALLAAGVTYIFIYDLLREWTMNNELKLYAAQALIACLGRIALVLINADLIDGLLWKYPISKQKLN